MPRVSPVPATTTFLPNILCTLTEVSLKTCTFLCFSAVLDLRRTNVLAFNIMRVKRKGINIEAAVDGDAGC